MHPTTILSMLGCALGSAYLVFVEEWDATYAGLTVAGSVMATGGLLLAILWAVSAAEEKAEFAREALAILQRDLGDFLRFFHLIR